MARLLLILLTLALAAPALALPGKPTVSVPATHPFVVAGSHFEPHERVHLVVVAHGTGARTVTAGPRGGFVARFPALSPTEPCSSYTVRATGSLGSRAALKVMPECPQPVAP